MVRGEAHRIADLNLDANEPQAAPPDQRTPVGGTTTAGQLAELAQRGGMTLREVELGGQRMLVVSGPPGPPGPPGPAGPAGPGALPPSDRFQLKRGATRAPWAHLDPAIFAPSGPETRAFRHLLIKGLTQIQPSAAQTGAGVWVYDSDRGGWRYCDGAGWRQLFNLNGGGSAVTIAGDNVTVTGPYHFLDTEGGAATDNVSTITGGVAGDLVVFRLVSAARKVTFLDGTNVLLLDGQNVQLEDLRECIIFERIASNIWREVARNKVRALWTMDLMAGTLQPTADATNPGCAALANHLTATWKVDYRSLDFDQTTQQHAFVNGIPMPDRYDGGAFTAIPYWTAVAGSGGVVWGVNGREHADLVSMDQAWPAGTENGAKTYSGTADQIHISPAITFTPGGAGTGGRTMALRIYRKVSDAGDTLTANARLLGVRIEYAGNRASD